MMFWTRYTILFSMIFSVLVTFSMYFISGFFYLRLVRGAKGIEQIPNRNFWFKAGNLLAVSVPVV